jgi:5-methylcytosine-specific restriction endonuclease McrA
MKLTQDQIKERKREADRRWRKDPANAEKERELKRRWREDPANAERKLAAQRRWQAENREASSQSSHRYRAENPEKVRLAGLRWARENPDKARANCVKRRALKRGATVGDPKAIAAVYRKAKSKQPISCAYCGKDTRPGERHVDHAIALAHEDRGPHSADNLVIACARCNRRKHTKTPDEFRALLAREGRGA